METETWNRGVHGVREAWWRRDCSPVRWWWARWDGRRGPDGSTVWPAGPVGSAGTTAAPTGRWIGPAPHLADRPCCCGTARRQGTATPPGAWWRWTPPPARSGPATTWPTPP